MKWNVYRHDMRLNGIEVFNIFEHGRFSQDVEDLLNEHKDKNEFAIQLKNALMFYFWCKAEYEIIISPWCGSKNVKEVKVDIYNQVMNNWDVFLDYVWSNKKVQQRKSTTKTIGYSNGYADQNVLRTAM